MDYFTERGISPELDETSSVPLYTQLANLLRGRIACGYWQKGQLIPSEAKLMREFGVSRGTVRQAIDQLIQQNLLYRKRGKGSFVTATKIRQSLNEFYDLGSSFMAIGMDLQVEVKCAREQDAPAMVIERLLLAPGSKVFWIERVLSAQGEVLIVEHVFVPAELFPNLLEHDLSEKNLYDLFLREYGFMVARAQESFNMVEVCRHEGRYFGNLLMPLLQHFRTTFDEIQPFEFRRSTIRGDVCSYHVEIKVR